MRKNVLYKVNVICKNFKYGCDGEIEEGIFFSCYDDATNIEVYDALEKVVKQWGSDYELFGYYNLQKYF